MNYLPEQKSKQLQYESDAWKRVLGFMSDENIRLKNRLSEILKDNFNKNLLEDVENFLSKFIKEDELICILWNDLNELDKLLMKEIFEVGKLNKKIEIKLNKLRNNMLTAERQFGKLKLAFSSYFIENI